MRRAACVIALLVGAALLAGCGGDPPQVSSTGSSSESRPPTRYYVNGQPYPVDTDHIALPYDTISGSNNDPAQGAYTTTLNGLLSNRPQMSGPVVNDFADLPADIRSLYSVEQRAIRMTQSMVDAGQPINLMPSKPTLAIMGRDTPLGADAPDNVAGNVRTLAFGSVYFEKKDGITTAVLVYVSNVSSSRSHEPLNTFQQWYGWTTYPTAVAASPGAIQSPDVNIWNALALFPDCDAQQDPAKLSARCVYFQQDDLLRYQGTDNVLLPTRVHMVQAEIPAYGDNDGTNFTKFFAPIGYRGQQVTALAASGYPYASPPLQRPITNYMADLFADGGRVLGGNDLLNLPAYPGNP